MTHRLSVDFNGLCVFAAERAPKSLSVLMASLADTMMQHRPILSFNVRNLVHFSRGNVEQIIQLPNGDQIASWHLDRRIVKFRSMDGARPSQVVLCRDEVTPSRCPQNPMSELDLCWVPSLKRIAGVDKVDPDLLGKNPPRGKKSGIAARIDFESGNLFAHAAVNRLSPSEFWTFAPTQNGPIEQYLADTVRLEVESTPDATLIIEAYEFGKDRQPAETLVLKPYKEAIELAISNLPDMVAHPEHGVEASMDHFAAYYGLLKTAPKFAPIPTTNPASQCGAVSASMPMSAGRKSARGATAGQKGMPIGMMGVFPVRCTPGIIP
jgi:hypothetical protein